MIAFHDAFRTDRNEMWVIMELCELGSLRQVTHLTPNPTSNATHAHPSHRRHPPYRHVHPYHHP